MKDSPKNRLILIISVIGEVYGGNLQIPLNESVVGDYAYKVASVSGLHN